jgi:hypothetical protein
MSEATEQAERTFEIIGGVSGIISLVAFAYIGQLLFDGTGGIAIGAVAGVLAGAGEYLFLPALLGAQQDGGLFSGSGETILGFDRFVLGMALATGGIATLAGGFIFDGQPVMAIAVGVVVTVIDAVFVGFVFGVLGE